MVLEGNTFFMDWEVALMAWLQAHMGTAGKAAAGFFTLFGEELICVALLGFLYWGYNKEYGKYVGLNALTGIVLNPMIKNVFLRRRPYFDHTEIACLRPVTKGADIYDIAAQGYSFPSGHSTNAVTVYSSIAWYPGRKRNRALTVICILLTLLIGISRFCLGVHYPTDVVCGWLLGLAVIFLISYLNRKIRSRAVLYAILLLATLPGFFYCKSDDYYSAYGLLAGFIAAITFEEKFVNFENTRSFLRQVLRVLFGSLLFFALTSILKKPFSSAFLESGTLAAHIVRVFRYGISIFAVIGLYPMAFRLTDRFFTKSASR